MDRSSQARWQRKKLKEGLCCACGQNPLVTRTMCDPCRIKCAIKNANRHRAAKGMPPLPAGHAPKLKRRNSGSLGSRVSQLQLVKDGLLRARELCSTGEPEVRLVDFLDKTVVRVDRWIDALWKTGAVMPRTRRAA